MAFVKVDEAKAIAAGYSPEEIAAENDRRVKEESRRTTEAQDYKLRKEGGTGGFVENTAAGMGKMMTDSWLGARQGLADLGLGNKEALAEEAADKKRLDAPLSGTVGGQVGDVGMNMLASFAPMGAVARGVGLLPRAYRGANLAARGAEEAVRGAASGAIGGAAMETLAPEEDYSLKDQLAKGAAFGAGGDVLGRVAGRVYAPFRNAGAGATARENAALLNNAGLPRQIPATQTDSPMVRHATNALEQIPIFGAGVRGARNENLEFLTRQNTIPTGISGVGQPRGSTVTGARATGVPELTPSAQRRMVQELDAEGNRFRTQTQITMSPVAADAQQAVANVRQYAQDTAQLSGLQKLQRSARSIADRQVPVRPMPPGVPAPPPGIGGRGPTRSVPQTRTAEEVMDLRNAASKLAYETTDPVLRQQYRNYRNSLTDELRTVHGSDRFDDWLRQWGAMEEVMHAAGGKSGKELVSGKLTPERLVANIDDSVTRPMSGVERLNSAFAGNIPSAPSGWNRAMISALLLGGSPVAFGAGTDLVRGDFGPGTLAGLTASGSMVRGLSRRAPSQERIDALRRAISTMTTGTGMQF